MDVAAYSRLLIMFVKFISVGLELCCLCYLWTKLFNPI